MTELRKEINYVVACVSDFAHKYNISQKEAFEFLYEYKAIQFLKENYDIEHTLSMDEAISDLMMICEKNGGVLNDFVPRLVKCMREEYDVKNLNPRKNPYASKLEKQIT